MLTRFFDRITRASVTWRWLTILLTFAVLAAGGYSYTQINQELVPPVEFPQTILVAQWPDAASTDDFLTSVTIPLEQAMEGVEGVVNVESTTNKTLGVFIVRNEFGENQARLTEEIQAAAGETSLPEGVDPEVFNFNLSDLPVVIASVSSSELSLPELKELIETELEPQLADIEFVSQVNISGGQELPEVMEESEQLAVGNATVEEVQEGEQSAVNSEAVEEADLNALSPILIAGLAVYGIDVEFADEIPPNGARALIYEGGMLSMQALELLTPDNLRLGLPETLAYLPSDYVETLDEELVDELNELSAEFGGIAQYSIAEAIEARDAGLDVLTGLPVADGTIADFPPALEAIEEVEEVVEVEEVADAAPIMVDSEPIDLPDAWISAAASQNLEIATTADLTPELVGGIAQVAPQMLAMLTPDMLLAMPVDAFAALPDDFLATLDSDLLAELTADTAAASTEATAPSDPIALPDTWVGAASIQGLTVATTADATPELVASISTAAPQLLADLTPAMLLAMPLEVFPSLPQSYLAQLDADTQAALQARFASATAPQTGLPLPEEWIEIAASRGIELATTDDLTADLVAGVAIFAPSRLAQLTDEMLLAAPAEALLGLPESYVAGLSAEIQTAVAAAPALIAAEMEAASEPAENEAATASVALPEEWIALAAQQNLQLETTADLTPEVVSGIAQFAPEALEALTLDMVLALSPEILAVLPSEFIATLDEDIVVQLDLDLTAEATTVEEPASDPAELSPIFATVGEQVGAELATVADITPDFIRQVGAFGEQGMQLLGLLTPDNLLLLEPEAVALLPADFLDTIEDDNLRVYLDGRAVEFGGAGQLLLAEAEAAAALSEGAPVLTGIWLVPDENGEPSQFQTAADILNNPFAPGGAALLNFFPTSPNVDDPLDWMGELNLEAITFMAENEEGFAETLQANIVEMLPAESITYLLDTYPDAYDEATTSRLADVATGNVEVFIPEATITRSDGDPSLLVQVFKNGDANTVKTFAEVEAIMEEFSAENPINYLYAFEQSTFIEESIEGVTREGVLGALFAVIVILIFLSGRINGKYRLSWRATLITGLSIPASVLFAMLLMWLLPRTIGPWITDLALDSDNILLTSLAKLFPAKLTLNIMTLSGLTVAIGRVVDDSIVVLENSYRYIQKGEAPTQAVYRGTREVAVAIFAATITTMAVFLPIGFVGGLISEFFLPFGLTVTYALAASYIVSITVVPALTALLIRRENIPEERETAMQRGYTPILQWALNNRLLTMGIATLIFIGSLFLITQLPNSFIPGLGEPTVNVTVELPAGSAMADTDAQIREFELELDGVEGIETVLTEVGSGGGQEALFGGGAVNQSLAALTISVEEGTEIDDLSAEVRELAQARFGEENVLVTAAVQAGFSGFALIVTGDSLDEIVQYAPEVEAALAGLDADEDGALDLVNVGSNAGAAIDGTTIIRIDGQPAVSFSADLQTSDTIGVAAAGIAAIDEVIPSSLAVAEGFDSQQQTEGFQGMVSAIGVSIVLVYLIMALTFRSLVHPFTILFSLPFALVGASIALFITQSVLGISAMMGLLMLVGVVVTNGIVLLEMVQQLKEEGYETYSALVEAGRTRLRPIWMTALTAILALIPLAASTEGGAIIAAELGTAVIGGLIVSTALTLVVIPVVYSLFDQVTTSYDKRQYSRLSKRFGVTGD